MTFHSPRPVAQPPHRVPGLFDIPQVGRRRRRAELSELVESLRAPMRLIERVAPATLTGAC